MNARITSIVAAALGFIGVSLGAFGAHSLRSFLVTSGHIETYELATRYLFYHITTLLFIGIYNRQQELKLLKHSALSFAVGVFLFSGSLYTLSLSGITKFGIITPIGGVFLLVGWTLLVAGLIKK